MNGRNPVKIKEILLSVFFILVLVVAASLALSTFPDPTFELGGGTVEVDLLREHSLVLTEQAVLVGVGSVDHFLIYNETAEQSLDYDQLSFFFSEEDGYLVIEDGGHPLPQGKWELMTDSDVNLYLTGEAGSFVSMVRSDELTFVLRGLVFVVFLAVDVVATGFLYDILYGES